MVFYLTSASYISCSSLCHAELTHLSATWNNMPHHRRCLGFAQCVGNLLLSMRGAVFSGVVGGVVFPRFLHHILRLWAGAAAGRILRFVARCEQERGGCDKIMASTTYGVIYKNKCPHIAMKKDEKSIKLRLRGGCGCAKVRGVPGNGRRRKSATDAQP